MNLWRRVVLSRSLHKLKIALQEVVIAQSSRSRDGAGRSEHVQFEFHDVRGVSVIRLVSIVFIGSLNRCIDLSHLYEYSECECSVILRTNIS